MKVWRYSRWDGSLAEFSLDAKQVLDAMTELMMEGLSAQESRCHEGLSGPATTRRIVGRALPQYRLMKHCYHGNCCHSEGASSD